MTQIDFYILDEHAPNDGDRFACRLVEKVVKQGHQVHIHVEDGAHAQQLDDLLWTFQAGSFIPHALAGAEPDPDAPVQIGKAEETPNHDEVLVNLAAEVPLFFSRFQRVAEVVAGDEAQRRRARERFRFYRDRGYPMKTHNIGGR